MHVSLMHQTKESSTPNHLMFNLLNMNTNERIRYRMTQLGLQQTDLIRATGASNGTVSLWVNGPGHITGLAPSWKGCSGEERASPPGRNRLMVCDSDNV